MNNKKLTLSLALVVALVAGSCGGSGDGQTMSKEEARAFMKTDFGTDLCELFGAGSVRFRLRRTAGNGSRGDTARRWRR